MSNFQFHHAVPSRIVCIPSVTPERTLSPRRTAQFAAHKTEVDAFFADARRSIYT